MNPSGLIVETFKVWLEGLALTLFDICQATSRLRIDSSGLELSDEFVRELGPTPDWVGRELVEPLLCYLCQGDNKASVFGQVVHLEEIHLIVERVQVVTWINLPLIAWYLGHLESMRKRLFLNLPSEGRVIIIPYLFSLDGEVFNTSSQLIQLCQCWPRTSWLLVLLVEVDEGDSLLLWRSLSHRSRPWSLSTSPADLPIRSKCSLRQ